MESQTIYKKILEFKLGEINQLKQEEELLIALWNNDTEFLENAYQSREEFLKLSIGQLIPKMLDVFSVITNIEE